jgi:hypothetical protein
MNRDPSRKVILFTILAALLAIVLKDAVWDDLVSPALYQIWLAWIFLRSMPQIIYWNSLVILIALVAMISLVRQRRRKSYLVREFNQTQNPVAKVVNSIKDLHRGNFFKWLLANQLGSLARSILIYHHGEGALPKRKLMGRTWDPPENVQRYLEAGLARSFIDRPRRLDFFRSSKTPLDIDINQVVEYLENQMEIKIEH